MTTPAPDSSYVPAGQLRRALRDYGLRRYEAAKICGVADITFNRYTFKADSPHHKRMPLTRWQRLQKHLTAIDERMES